LLDNTQVSDVGLALLKACENLTRVDVRNTKVTAAGKNELKLTAPRCQFDQ
jgi:hypothetical protein